MKQKSFGPHLTLDLTGCPKEILENIITKTIVNNKNTFFFKLQWQY